MKRIKNIFLLMAMAAGALAFTACNNKPDDDPQKTSAKASADSAAAAKIEANIVRYEGKVIVKNDITKMNEIIRFIDSNGTQYPLSTENDGAGDTVTLKKDRSANIWHVSERGATDEDSAALYITVKVLRRAGETLKKGNKTSTADKQITAPAPDPKRVDTTSASAVVSKPQTASATGSKGGSPAPAQKKNTGVMTATKK